VWFAVKFSGRGSQVLWMIELAHVPAARGNAFARLQLDSALSTQSRDGSVPK
jgi:hypothetical protein